MAQKLGTLLDWRVLAEGVKLELKGGLRSVALEINAPEPINLYAGLNQEDIFVGRFEGRDRVEFTVDGDFFLYGDGGELWFITTDDVVVNTEADPADPIFTRIANRRDRNPNLEAIEWRMRQNMERRFAEMQAEAQRRSEDDERLYAARRRIVTPPSLLGGEGAGDDTDGSEAELGSDTPRETQPDARKGGGGGGKPPAKPKPAAAADD